MNLSYTVQGSGPLVALVQGLGLAGAMWLDLPAGLSRRGYAVLTPDARGTGDSDAPLPPYHMHDLADDLAGILRTVDRGPAIVVGASMGGMVAQHLALRNPELVAGLVLAATTCGLPHGRLPNPLFVARILYQIFAPERARPGIRRMLLAPGRFDRSPELFDTWDRTLNGLPRPWKGIVGHLSAAARHNTGSRLHQIRCPAVVLSGNQDIAVPVENARILARGIPGAELMLVPDAGHAFALEDPMAFPRAVDRVAERVRSAGPPP